MANDLNRVALTGRLTRDPELRSLASGTSVCSFGMAYNTSTKGADGWEDKGNFIDITVWGARGETVAKYCSKGDRIALDGRLEFQQWEAQDGTNRSKTQVVADNVVFLQTKPKDETGESAAAPAREEAPF